MFLELCSFLDPRYKQEVTLKMGYNKEKMIEQIARFCKNAVPESQDFIQSTESQDQVTLTDNSIINYRKKIIKIRDKISC